jgi:rod shape determining protein RodA
MPRRFDFFIYTSIIGLSIFSLFNIFGISKSLIDNQIVYIVLGNIAFFIFYMLGISFFKFNSRLFFIIATVLLIITYIIGVESRGSKRWIDFYLFRFQSSEFLKLFFIIYLADFLSTRKTTFRNLCITIAIFIPPIFLIFKQPDLGNAIIYECI